MPASRNIPARGFVALAIMVALLNSTASSPLYAVYRELWSLDTFTISAVFATYAGGTLLALLVLGRLSDRLPDRRIVICGALLLVIAGSLVFGTASDLEHLFLGRFLAGAGTGGVAGTASAALLELDPKLDARRSATLATSVFTIACALGPVITSACLALDLDPLRLPFLIVAGLSLVALVGLVAVPFPARRSSGGPPVAATAADGSTAPPRIAGFAIAAAAVFIAWAVGSCFAALGPSFVRDLLGARSVATAGLIVTVFQLVGGISQMGFGSVASPKALVIGSAIVAAAMALCALAIEIAAPALFVAGTVLVGIGYGAAFVGAAGVVNRVAPPDRRATYVSAFYVTAYLSNSLPVLLLGRLSDMIGLADAFVALTGFAVVAVLVLLPAALAVLKPFARRPAR